MSTNDGMLLVDVIESVDGITLRDWFAGMALKGWLSAYKGTTHPVTTGIGSSFASNAYAMADEMLKAREAK